MIAELLAATAMWQTDPPLPLARSEVAGASWRGGVAVVGGYLADGQSSARVDVYNARVGRWERLPDLPVAVNHAMAASGGGRLYVFARSDAFVYDGRWRRLPSLPFSRVAGGAAFVDNTVYVVGGVGPLGVARSALAYDVRRRRWRTLPAPRPLREHLGVTTLRGRVYAVGGRANGQTFSTVQRWLPGRRRWQLLAPLPEPRGGTAAGAAYGLVVSAGAESAAGTSGAVYAYSPRENRWRRLPDLPTPRHGLAVVGDGATIHVVAGGPQPGLSVSSANESLLLTG
ncbi:MAG: Kelch repeat-containing protein [Gaiellaceae bacterium]